MEVQVAHSFARVTATKKRAVLLGEVGGAPFYLGHQEFAYYGASQLTLDVQPGNGGDFSLDCGTGRAFVTRSRLMSDAELADATPVIPG